jgi:transcriptional regulator with XRE-family HTH domain
VLFLASVKRRTKTKALRIIGESIRNSRKETDASQERRAEIMNVHRNYIGKIERGEQNLTVCNLVSLAKALRCKTSDILRDTAL